MSEIEEITQYLLKKNDKLYRRLALAEQEEKAMIKCDTWIIDHAKHGMITPFSPESVKTNGSLGIISYGVSSYGYDVMASDEFKLFTNLNASIINPKRFDPSALIDAELHSNEDGVYIIIPPNSYALARTVEYIKMPRNVTGLMTTKSTYARCGIVSPPTVLEAGWEGHITIEISNPTELPAMVFANEGIGQVLFLESDEDCRISYADRAGKYQGQTGITLPKV